MAESGIQENQVMTFDKGVVTYHAIEGDEQVPFDELHDGEKRILSFIQKYYAKTLKGVRINKK